jgi:hypothetical protein
LTVALAFKALSTVFAIQSRFDLQLRARDQHDYATVHSPLADNFGRAPVMSRASISFLVAAFIGFRMPEIVIRRT